MKKFCNECGIIVGVKVCDSRSTKRGVRRRNECPQGHRFSTYEIQAAEYFGIQNAVLDFAKGLQEAIQQRLEK